MTSVERDCAFCDYNSADIRKRTVYFGTNILAIVSRPWFRENHLLVLPKQHRKSIAELDADEKSEMMDELDFLSTTVGTEFGYMVFQKHRPQHAPNGITMEHLHFHVYPILATDTALVPAPTVGDFSPQHPTDDEIESTKRIVQDERAKRYRTQTL